MEFIYCGALNDYCGGPRNRGAPQRRSLTNLAWIDRRNRKSRNTKILFHIFLLRLFYCGRCSSRPKWLPKHAELDAEAVVLRRNRSFFLRPACKSDLITTRDIFKQLFMTAKFKKESYKTFLRRLTTCKWNSKILTIKCFKKCMKNKIAKKLFRKNVFWREARTVYLRGVGVEGGPNSECKKQSYFLWLFFDHTLCQYQKRTLI